MPCVSDCSSEYLVLVSRHVRFYYTVKNGFGNGLIIDAEKDNGYRCRKGQTTVCYG